jgi:hypothetical protein
MVWISREHDAVATDWGNIHKVYRAWWAGAIDWPLVSVTGPKDPADWENGRFDEARLVRERDIAAHVQRFLGSMQRTRYSGFAFPHLYLYLGPSAVTSFLTGTGEVHANTVWYPPSYSLYDLERMPFRPTGDWWEFAVTSLREAMASSKGRWITSLPDITGVYDVLAALRGPEALIFDLVDHPGQVHSIAGRISDFIFMVYEGLSRIAGGYQACTTSWMRLLAASGGAYLACDFSAIVSPSLFGEFARPLLVREAEAWSSTVYHLDGPHCLPHLDQLLSIPALGAVQWTPGYGQPGVLSPDWFPLYERILAAGKKVVLLEDDTDAGALHHALSSFPRGGKGIYFTSLWTKDMGEVLRVVSDHYSEL